MIQFGTAPLESETNFTSPSVACTGMCETRACEVRNKRPAAHGAKYWSGSKNSVSWGKNSGQGVQTQQKTPKMSKKQSISFGNLDGPDQNPRCLIHWTRKDTPTATPTLPPTDPRRNVLPAQFSVHCFTFQKNI